MRSRGRILSYANVTATLALVFAMSGGALAAKHYLIKSTGQISPKVLKKLKGNTGKTGPGGAQGATGATGAKGETGPKGEAGLSALATLPSGATESGTFGFRHHELAEEFVAEPITFPVPLSSRIATSHIIYTNAATPVEHCPGPRHADPGYLCFYALDEGNLKAEHFYENPESEAEEEGEGTSPIGVVIEWKTVAAVNTLIWGTYALTAP